jgi:ATP-dependent helicase/nuclease subunit A
MVGDVKQSIYRFRLARPEIFMEKFNTYERKDSLKQRIDLHKNFRSRKEVLDTVNYVFSQLMEEDLGKVSYDEAARLNLGANYPANQSVSSEFLFMEIGDTQEDKKELEAKMIARRMKQLIQEFQVTDKKSGELRPATYGDMVVLLRTNSGWDDVFSRIFAEEGIPAYSTSKTGYFETLEIRSLLNILRVIDNPMQDIPLFGVLHSMVGGFLDEELATVKARSNKCSFYEKMLQYLEEGESDKLKNKITKFTEMLDDFRNRAVFTPIHKLILYIYEKTGFYYIYSSLPSGIQRRANLDMLMEKAMNFETTSYYGLFHFIRYIEQIEKFEVDYGEAGILDEQADVVRLMSIHKSKGLEFPICFVAGLGKNFNEMDLRSELVLDVDFGVGTKAIDLDKRTKSNTFRRNVLAKKMQLENIGEEIRVLYVALTRPKEKLIMTGAVKELSKELLYFQQILDQEETVLSFLIRSQAKSYLDLLIPAFIRNQCFETLLAELGAKQKQKSKLYEAESEFIVTKVLPGDLELSQQKEQIGKKVKEMLLDEKQKTFSAENTIYQNLSRRFREIYPHERLGDLFLKTTVSELKKNAYMEVSEESLALYEEEEIIPYIPKFLKQEEKMSSTVRGSAYHKVLELLSLENIKSVEEEVQDLLEGGKLTAEYAAAVSAKKIRGFLDSKLALRMKEAKKRKTLFKEQPFVLGVKANIIRETFPEEETILVQGVIDVYFEEEDGIVVADYKTDRVATKEELILRYQTQLDYYATALEQLTGKKVKEKIIYSFSLMEEIMLPHDRSSL